MNAELRSPRERDGTLGAGKGLFSSVQYDVIPQRSFRENLLADRTSVLGQQLAGARNFLVNLHDTGVERPVKDEFGLRIRREHAILALPFSLHARIRLVVLGAVTLSRMPGDVLRQGEKQTATRTSVAKFRMGIEKVILVRSEIRLLLVAV